MRFQVTLRNQHTGVCRTVEVQSSYDATAVLAREAKAAMNLPRAWDCILAKRVHDDPTNPLPTGSARVLGSPHSRNYRIELVTVAGVTLRYEDGTSEFLTYRQARGRGVTV